MIMVEKKKKQGRNEPCACGSGKKYKKCCDGILSVSKNRDMPIASLIQEAVTHHKSGNFEMAERIYNQVLSLEKNNADALQLLGEIAYQRKDYPRAVDLIGQATDINQTSPVVYRNFGNALREIGEYDAALDAFMNAIDLKPDELSVYENLADTIKRSNYLGERSIRYFMKGLAQEEISPKSKYGMFVLLGYVIKSSPEWNKHIFEQVILPSTQDALDRGDYLFAYFVSCLTAVSYAQQPHTSQQWKAVHALTNPMYISAGEKLHKTLPGLVFPNTVHSFPVLGFVIDLGLSAGSGEILLINFFRGFSKLHPLPFQFVVYTLDNASMKMKNICSERGLKLVDLSIDCGKLSSEKGFFQRLLTLRNLIQKDKVSALVYPGTYEAFPCLAASMGLAPVQIYLSMGFRSIFIPMMDGYVTTGSPVKSKKEFEGRSWRTGPLPHEDIYPSENGIDMAIIDDEVSFIRQEKFSQYKVILGTLARAQKLENPLFIEALADILHANPEAVFLWFGPEYLLSVRQMMVEQGISERCLFQGWVDIKVYAKLLDIHLDSFPFPTALAMLDTMSAATASIWMEEDSEIGVGSNVMPLIRGEVGTKKDQEEIQAIFSCPKTGALLALCADSPGQYVAYVQHLIDDIPFRKAVGVAGRRYMEHFCHDPSVAARAYAEHFIEILGEKDKLEI